MAKVCVPICVGNIEEIRDAINAVADVADIVELRADCLPVLDTEIVLQTAGAISKPLILTLRSPEQGGVTANDFATRRRFWMSATNLPAGSLVDLELDMVEEFSRGESAGLLPIDWDRVICSHHDLDRVPEDLQQIFERMAATPAGLIKIALQATDAVDCLALFDLLERARNEDRKIIAIAMGQAGIMTRILGPARGSFLTYGSRNDESGTAPGQLQAKDLRDGYRIDSLDRDTQVFGIIGNPVSHSWSPPIHNAAFAANNLNAVFLSIEVHHVLEFIRRMVHPRTRELDWDLNGLAVTAPHKSMVMQQLDWIDPVCREIGACNTVVVRGDQLCGYNTDAAGFIAPLRDALGTIRDARCAIVGAGGAARACLWALKQEAADVTVFARDKSQAEFLAKTFGVEGRAFPATSFKGFDVVINATPLGTRGEREHESIATAEQLRGVRLAYDLVYNPSATTFLREARSAGCKVLDGMEMLLAQAVEQFNLWTRTQPDVKVMRAAAMRKLSS